MIFSQALTRVEGQRIRLALLTILILCIWSGCWRRGLGWQEVASVADATIEFETELSRLKQICKRFKLEEAAEVCERWLPDSRSDRRILYVPLAIADLDLAKGKNEQETQLLESWQQHFLKARKQLAQALYAEAKRKANSGQEDEAFRLLWRVLREDGEHEQARKILGGMARPLRSVSGVRVATEAMAKLGWPPRTYREIQTPHFVLYSRANPKVSRELAKQLETVFVLWRQAFYEAWAPPGLLTQLLDNAATGWPRSRDGKMEVVLLKDRKDYLTTLGVAEENIDVSVGFYSPEAELSFFYPAEDKDDLLATLIHEVTHQLFSESMSFETASNPGSEQGGWIVEGVALYMESLAEGTGFWSLGGIESRRLQTARYRALRDGYFPDWESFTMAGLEEWKQDSELTTLYSHAAGLTHFFQDLQGQQSSSRDVFLTALMGVYRGEADFTKLKQLISSGDEQDLSAAYQKSLTVSAEQLAACLDAPSQTQDLVLTGSEFPKELWNRLAERQWQWLDLSFSNVAESDLKWLGGQGQLARLSLEGTRINEMHLSEVGKIGPLQELDLSSVPDLKSQSIAAVAGLGKLTILWLTETEVDDSVLPIIDRLKNLQRCDVSKTRIGREAWDRFLMAHPQLVH